MNYKKQVTMLVSVLLMSVMIGGSQTRDEFRQRYSAPQKDHYLVRPDIMMTVLYSEEGQTKELTIKSLPLTDQLDDQLMSRSTVTEIIDKIAPNHKRGAVVQTNTFSAGCTSVETEEYEKMSISHIVICPGQNGGGIAAVKVKWKFQKH